jgi:hypothetical protein
MLYQRSLNAPQVVTSTRRATQFSSAACITPVPEQVTTNVDCPVSNSAFRS